MNAVTSQIRSAFGLKSANSKRSRAQWETTFFMDLMDIKVKYGLNRRAGEMLYGILWAYRTGRLTVTSEMALRAMNAYKFADLLAKVMDKCAVMGDVPAFLNAEVK